MSDNSAYEATQRLIDAAAVLGREAAAASPGRLADLADDVEDARDAVLANVPGKPKVTFKVRKGTYGGTYTFGLPPGIYEVHRQTEGGDHHGRNSNEPIVATGEAEAGPDTRRAAGLATRREDGRADNPEGGTAREKPCTPPASPDAGEVVATLKVITPVQLGAVEVVVSSDRPDAVLPGGIYNVVRRPVDTPAKTTCPHGHNRDGWGCELGHPGCLCADEIANDPEAMDEYARAMSLREVEAALVKIAADRTTLGGPDKCRYCGALISIHHEDCPTAIAREALTHVGGAA